VSEALSISTNPVSAVPGWMLDVVRNEVRSTLVFDPVTTFEFVTPTTRLLDVDSGTGWLEYSRAYREVFAPVSVEYAGKIYNVPTAFYAGALKNLQFASSWHDLYDIDPFFWEVSSVGGILAHEYIHARIWREVEDHAKKVFLEFLPDSIAQLRSEKQRAFVEKVRLVLKWINGIARAVLARTSASQLQLRLLEHMAAPDGEDHHGSLVCAE
jgi:hypothetical protein